MVFILASIFFWVLFLIFTLLAALIQYNFPRFNLVWLFSVFFLVGCVYSISLLDFSLLIHFSIAYTILCVVSLLSLKVRSKLIEVEKRESR